MVNPALEDAPLVAFRSTQLHAMPLLLCLCHTDECCIPSTKFPYLSFPKLPNTQDVAGKSLSATTAGLSWFQVSLPTGLVPCPHVLHTPLLVTVLHFSLSDSAMRAKPFVLIFNCCFRMCVCLLLFKISKIADRLESLMAA